MNKQTLNKLLGDEITISQEDIAELKSLAKEYPYSQLLHILVAKGSYTTASKSAQADLNMAAIYSTDRTVLKNVITGAKIVSSEVINEDSAPKEKIETIPSKVTIEVKKPEKSLNNVRETSSSGDALRAEVMRNLDLLMESKKAFDIEFDHESGIVTTSAKDPQKKELKTSKKTSKSKKELSKKNKKEEVDEDTPSLDENSSKDKQVIIKNESEYFSEKDVIDSFIKKQPSIIKKIRDHSDTKQPQQDLSETSSKFGDDLISENLAIILTKQGKNEKAIDIYKKLIWKFPQKKAYFATQIEALKK